MAVQFILGRSGTGKTTYCLRAIVEALLADSTQPLILLVPEQATYQAERAILSDPRIAGYHRLQIISFNRLQFFLADKDTATPRISNIGRQMMVHKILRDSREQLQVFRSSALLPGFARQIAGTITELHRYAKTPEDLETLETQLRAEKGSGLAALKFADISRVFAAYTDALGDRFVDPDAQTRRACQEVANAGFLKGARLWVDGFAGFTGAELALLLELLGVVDQAQIALCLDPDGIVDGEQWSGAARTNDFFEPTDGTYRELLDQIHVAQIEVLKPLVLEKVMRFSDSGPLAHLEKNLFRLAAPRAAAGEAIHLAAAPNLRDEVQFVAGRIRRLVQEKGYRYRDIAVVASDLGRYEHYVGAYFNDYGIPFFIDQRQPLNQHPVVELITAALQTATGGFAHADICAYLKTDLLPIKPTDVDVLENYCLAFGVDGRDWCSPDPWRFKGVGDEDFDERAIDRIRNRVAGPLLELREALYPNGKAEDTLTAGDFTRAVFGFLEGLQIRCVVGQWVEQAQQAGDPTVADEHRQLFEKLLDIFDELVTVFEREAMTARDFLAILNLAFSQMTLAFIPPRLDQVLVGSIERSRHPNLKAVFLLGATQKQFPIPIPASGVLTDADRDAAEGVGFHLAPPSIQSLAERQYLAYIAFTRPSEVLCVSYPAVDEKGAPLVRSHFVDELASLFEDLAEEFIGESWSDLTQVHTQSELAEALCCRLGRDVFAPEQEEGALQGLLQAMRADGDWAGTADSVVAALDYDNRAVLSRDVVDRLFGERLKSSATRLGAFAACPYKYFVRYALELKSRREFKLQPLDLGNFYHAVLDALHKRLAADGKNFATEDEDRLIQLTREQIATFAAEDAFISKFVSRSNHNAFVITNAGDLLIDCVVEIAQMARAGAFRPLLSEVGFGQARDAEQSLGPFELTLPNGAILSLSGKIDRMDVADVDGQKVALVFDYKRTKAAATFSWSHFYHGLNIQLPLYLLALSETAGPHADRVAGAFCMPIEHLPGTGVLGELAGKSDRFAHKAKGLFDGQYAGHLDPEVGSQWSTFYNFSVTKNDAQYGRYATSGALRSDDFQRLLAFTRARITALAGDITAGRIAVHPYRLGTQAACAFCDYKAVCRFDWQINDYNFLESKGKLDVVASPERP